MPAKSKTKKSRRSLKPTYGTIDVREPADIPALENMIKQGPITFVLVYADWCGHCQEYKKNTWPKLEAVPNKQNNLASVHFDQLENTSLKNAKIDGYPSMLVVGNDGIPATFNTAGEQTNAMPDIRNEELLSKLLTTPAPATTSVQAPTMSANTVLASTKPASIANFDAMSQGSMATPSAQSAFDTMSQGSLAQNNTSQGEPQNLINTLTPPSPADDLLTSQPVNMSAPISSMSGGAGLLNSLVRVSQDPSVLAAAGLGAAALALSSRRRGRASRRSRKLKQRGGRKRRGTAKH